MTAPRRLVHWATSAVASVAALASIAQLSAVPLPYYDGGTARLRLSWTARPERIESCRALSARELERREEHMRQRIECDGRFATYTLTVEVDGGQLDEAVIAGSGLRHDRPIHLLRDFDLAGGVHRVRVSFARREHTNGRGIVAPHPTAGGDTGIFAGRAEREMAERTRRARAAIPARLVLDTSMTFVPGRVAIITFDAHRRVLTVLTRERSW